MADRNGLLDAQREGDLLLRDAHRLTPLGERQPAVCAQSHARLAPQVGPGDLRQHAPGGGVADVLALQIKRVGQPGLEERADQIHVRRACVGPGQPAARHQEIAGPDVAALLEPRLPVFQYEDAV